MFTKEGLIEHFGIKGIIPSKFKVVATNQKTTFSYDDKNVSTTLSVFDVNKACQNKWGEPYTKLKSVLLKLFATVGGVTVDTDNQGATSEEGSDFVGYDLASDKGQESSEKISGTMKKTTAPDSYHYGPIKKPDHSTAVVALHALTEADGYLGHPVSGTSAVSIYYCIGVSKVALLAARYKNNTVSLRLSRRLGVGGSFKDTIDIMADLGFSKQSEEHWSMHVGGVSSLTDFRLVIGGVCSALLMAEADDIDTLYTLKW